MNTAKQIDHINMIVPNIEKALAWYNQNLGFNVTGRFMQDGFEIVYLSNGSITYEMFENPSLTSPVIDHIAYLSDDINADHAYYVAQGLQVSPINYIDFIWENGADYFFVTGVGGEKVELLKNR